MGKVGALRVALAASVAALSLVACAPPTLATPTVGSRATPTIVGPDPTAAPGPGVADLLAHPPAPGTTVDVAAIFSKNNAPRSPMLPDRAGCPTAWNGILADRPFQFMLFVLNGGLGNSLPDAAPWLIPAPPSAQRSGHPIQFQVPYQGRLRGHLGDPAYARCAHAERIFVVEAVAATDQVSSPMPPDEQILAGYANWARYHDSRFGYSLPQPPDWVVKPLAEPSVLSTLAITAPQWPKHPVIVRIHAGETQLDPFADPATTPSLLAGNAHGIFSQAGLLANRIKTADLAGYRIERQIGPDERSVAALISAHGRTYELALRYPVGFDAPQPLLTTYTAMVAGFQLDAPPGPTPTPPIKQSLGAGPLLGQAEILSRLRSRHGPDLALLDGRLVSEAEARRTIGPCGTFRGHPDGISIVTVHGTFHQERQPMPWPSPTPVPTVRSTPSQKTETRRLWLDAQTGEQLCGEVVDPGAQPWPTLAPGPATAPAGQNDSQGD